MNRVSGALIFIFALLYGLEAYSLESGFGSGVITPRSFPLLLAVILGLIGVTIFFSPTPADTPSGNPDDASQSAETDDSSAESGRVWSPLNSWVNIGLLLTSFVAYAFLLVPIGFLTATTLETSFVSQRFGAKVWQALVTGLLVSLMLYTLFVFALNIPLPVGRIFGGR